MFSYVCKHQNKKFHRLPTERGKAIVFCYHSKYLVEEKKYLNKHVNKTFALQKKIPRWNWQVLVTDKMWKKDKGRKTRG